MPLHLVLVFLKILVESVTNLIVTCAILDVWVQVDLELQVVVLVVQILVVLVRLEEQAQLKELTALVFLHLPCLFMLYTLVKYFMLLFYLILSFLNVIS